jgi:4-hydroxybenzoate polyprenyltransferase
MSAAFVFEFDQAQEVPAPAVARAFPLVLELDGTLLRTNLLLESALDLLKRRPLSVFLMVAWLLRGVAYLKHQLAVRSELAVELLPVNEQLVRHARAEALAGRTVIVATAASLALATRVCARFPFVTEVLASCQRRDLRGARKAAELAERFPGGFAYAGSAAADLHVWRLARFGLLAGSGKLGRRMAEVTAVEANFSERGATIRSWLRACRMHQWAKNGLLFLPLLLAGRMFHAEAWLACVAAFVAIGLTASGTYLVNDLLDLEADRRHWSKRHRPFAAGLIGIPQAAAASILLLGSGFAVAAAGGGLPVLALVGLYCAATLAYSIHLKRVPLLDVVVLAGLFTLRLALGASAAAVPLSSWLGVFSMFLFLSLALAKRSTEITRKAAAECPASGAAYGRGYLPADASLVIALGVAAAVAAVLVNVLYLVDEAFSARLYGLPELLWAVPVLIGLWLGRVWLLCGRGLLDDDPVVFAVTDRTSLLLGTGVVASFAGAGLLA